jgi:hypothetical protein
MKHWILSAFLGIFLFETFSVLPSRTSKPIATDSDYFISGLINVQPNASPESPNIPELAQLAKENGHSFAVFADHDSVEGRLLGLEKTYDGFDAYVETESSTPSGDLLVFFSHTSLENASPKQLSKAAYERFHGTLTTPELFVSVSHPSHNKRPWTQLDRFPDGMEVLNFDSLFWRKLISNPLDFLGLSLLYPLNPFITALRVIQPYPKDIANWDNMNSLEPRHFGILSSQFNLKVHWPKLNISWPTYREIFRLGSNIVFPKEPLSNDFQTRKRQIYRSIKEGRLAMVFQAIHPFVGNDFYLKCPNGLFRSGEIFRGDPAACEFIVKTPENLPYATKIRLLKNGELEKEFLSGNSEVHIPVAGVGQFRIETLVRPHSFFWILLRKWVPYVIYNPIFITG